MGKKKWILAATLLGLLVIAGWRLASCYIANLELQDELQDVAAQVGTKIGADPAHSEADLRGSVIRRAEKLDIALEPSQITVRRHGEGSEDPIYLSVDYNVRVNLLVCSVSLHFTPSSTR